MVGCEEGFCPSGGGERGLKEHSAARRKRMCVELDRFEGVEAGNCA
jgi:hypothetical protein